MSQRFSGPKYYSATRFKSVVSRGLYSTKRSNLAVKVKSESSGRPKESLKLDPGQESEQRVLLLSFVSEMALAFSAGQGVRHLIKSNSSLPLLHQVHSPLPITSSVTQVQVMAKSSNFSTHAANNAEGDERPYVPRRTLMYVPGHDMKKLMKIPKLNVDCAVLECEDGVAVNMKGQARINIKEALQNLKAPGVDLALRVNSVSSNLMEDDLNGIIGKDLGQPLEGVNLPQTILVPKVDTVDDLDFFTDRFRSSKLGRDYVPYLITYVESAEGLMNLRDVLKKASDYSKEGHYKIDGVVFGSDDFCADIGAERTVDASELIYARQKVVVVAKAFRLQAIDMVHVDIHDKEGLKTVSEQGAKKGFTGKQIIHPGQVAVVEAAFTPSSDRIQWASELIKAFDEHQAEGRGAFTFRGQMIDMPLLRQAKNVMSIVKNVHKS